MKKGTWTQLAPVPLALAAGVGVVDQAVKALVLLKLEPHGAIPVIPGFFDLVLVHNSGAAWGMLAGRTMLLAVISVGVLLALLVWFRAFADGWEERGLSLALLLGGIAGNLVDRIWRGQVVDFLSFHYRSFEWPAFNVADAAICVGIGAYMLSSFLRSAPEDDASGAAGGGDGAAA